ncbi:insulin gene enhancer protein isl-1 [Galendromus occidentalis]|uniref:Insulin gene enhancer protein isl-1 n=1 Tax=Galendromus occidentalis TaxID=34638 RepID=A0AAJ7L632_9ACAR|nr:insulin gene enhancer protein isl-1 [Galendromus occidentalis]
MSLNEQVTNPAARRRVDCGQSTTMIVIGCAAAMGRKMKSSRRTQSSCSMSLNPNNSVLMNSNTDGVAQAASSVQNGAQPECAGCQKPIRERYLLRALDQLWHEDCLKCACCDCRLGEVGSTLFHKANLILCKRDYLRLFGVTGLCSACHKQIPAFEMVMRARGNVYHLECFACQQCNHRFCVGDRFYLHENRILCEYDYEERMVFSQMGGQYPIHGAAQPMQQQQQPPPPHHHHHQQQQQQQQPGSPYSMNGSHTPTHHTHQGSSMMPLTPPQQQCLDRSPLTTPHHKQRSSQQQTNSQGPPQGQTGTPGAPSQPEGDILFDVTSNGSTVAGTPQSSQNPGSNSGK